jgi:hypothetical protein
MFDLSLYSMTLRNQNHRPLSADSFSSLVQALSLDAPNCDSPFELTLAAPIWVGIYIPHVKLSY